MKDRNNKASNLIIEIARLKRELRREFSQNSDPFFIAKIELDAIFASKIDEYFEENPKGHSSSPKIIGSVKNRRRCMKSYRNKFGRHS